MSSWTKGNSTLLAGGAGGSVFVATGYTSVLHNVICMTVTWSGSVTVASVADTSGNTSAGGNWVAAGPAVAASIGGETQQIWVCLNAKGGAANVITVTFSGATSGNGALEVCEFAWSGGAGATLRSQNGATATSTAANSGSAASVAGDLLYGGFVTFGGFSSIGAGYTVSTQQSGFWFDAYDLSSPGGSVVANATVTSGIWVANLVVIAPPASAPAGNALFYGSD